MSFLKALSRIGLVELDESDFNKIQEKKQRRAQSSGDASASSSSEEDELERLLRETQASIDAAGVADAAPAPAPAPAPPVGATPSALADSGDVPSLEGRDLSLIYTAAGIPESPFTAEKLLKVIDGLRALPAPSRRAAVLALDAADDNWSIADVILDAQRKGRALRAEQSRLSELVTHAEAEASAEIQQADEYLQAATAHIREQIAELESTLAAEVQQVTEQKAEIKARLTASRQSASREHARLDAEVARISQIPLTFGSANDG